MEASHGSVLSPGTTSTVSYTAIVPIMQLIPEPERKSSLTAPPTWIERIVRILLCHELEKARRELSKGFSEKSEKRLYEELDGSERRLAEAMRERLEVMGARRGTYSRAAAIWALRHDAAATMDSIVSACRSEHVAAESVGRYLKAFARHFVKELAPEALRAGSRPYINAHDQCADNEVLAELLDRADSSILELNPSRGYSLAVKLAKPAKFWGGVAGGLAGFGALAVKLLPFIMKLFGH